MRAHTCAHIYMGNKIASKMKRETCNCTSLPPVSLDPVSWEHPNIVEKIPQVELDKNLLNFERKNIWSLFLVWGRVAIQTVGSVNLGKYKRIGEALQLASFPVPWPKIILLPTLQLKCYNKTEWGGNLANLRCLTPHRPQNRGVGTLPPA